MRTSLLLWAVWGSRRDSRRTSLPVPSPSSGPRRDAWRNTRRGHQRKGRESLGVRGEEGKLIREEEVFSADGEGGHRGRWKSCPLGCL